MPFTRAMPRIEKTAALAYHSQSATQKLDSASMD